MKLKSYLFIALFGLSTLFVPSAFSNATTPVKGIDVVVQKNPGPAARVRHGTVNPDGMMNIELSEAGKYTITYADGPLKGRTIWEGEVKSAKTVSAKVAKEYVPAPAQTAVAKSRSNVKNNH